MGYSLAEAAKAAGVTKAAIWQSITNGRIAAKKDERNRWVIEPEEIERIYQPRAKSKCEETSRAVLEVELRCMKEKVSYLEKELEDKKISVESWREHAQRSVAMLVQDRQLQLERYRNAAPTVIQVPPDAIRTEATPEPPVSNPMPTSGSGWLVVCGMAVAIAAAVTWWVLNHPRIPS